MKNDSISIVGDYTPSQNINVITNKNTSSKNKQFNINIKGSNNLPKSRLRYHINPLNNSIDDDLTKQTRLREYENMISRGAINTTMNKDPITKSQKELINKTYDLRQDRQHSRNAINPITGDFAMPSISVKGANEINLRGYF